MGNIIMILGLLGPIYDSKKAPAVSPHPLAQSQFKPIAKGMTKAKVMANFGKPERIEHFYKMGVGYFDLMIYDGVLCQGSNSCGVEIINKVVYQTDDVKSEFILD